ncbi:hypothetical protein [Paenibacillus sp. SN-8-1]|uniref:hypothetical protein n=1 Tax=Paenibacillus sp. SN-8-1 TaxID=3435409 RepID=UPI003D9A7E33
MKGAHSAYTVDLTEQRIETSVLPKTPYNSPILVISGSFGSIQIAVEYEQLAEIEFALKEHMNGIPYPKENPPAEEVIA